MKEKERRKKEERARKEQQARKRGEREASETRQTERRNDREEVSNPTSGGGETLEQMLMSGTSRLEKKVERKGKKGMEKTSLAWKERFQNRQKERNQSEEMSSKGIESDRSQNSAGAAASNRQCEHYQHLCLLKFPCCKKFAPCNLCHKNSGCRMLMAKKKMRVLVCARFVDISKRYVYISWLRSFKLQMSYFTCKFC